MPAYDVVLIHRLTHHAEIIFPDHENRQGNPLMVSSFCLALRLCGILSLPRPNLGLRRSLATPSVELN
jgi:hypothetical protein